MDPPGNLIEPASQDAVCAAANRHQIVTLHARSGLLVDEESHQRGAWPQAGDDVMADASSLLG